jgi:HPt (histidine-containing phosphotransfer) domain-containing protein
MMHSTVFDFPGSLKRMGNDLQLFEEMVGFLRDDSPRWLGQLHTGYDCGNLDAVRHAAHTLRGQVANFGAHRAMLAAAAVEQAAREHRTADLPAAVGELDAAYDELLSAVDEVFHRIH